MGYLLIKSELKLINHTLSISCEYFITNLRVIDVLSSNCLRFFEKMLLTIRSQGCWYFSSLFFLTLQFCFFFSQFNLEFFNFKVYFQFNVLSFNPYSVVSIYVYFQLGICVFLWFLFINFPWYYMIDHDSIDLSLLAPVYEPAADYPNE